MSKAGFNPKKLLVLNYKYFILVYFPVKGKMTAVT